MIGHPYLTDTELSEQAIRVLFRELGPVNALRFIGKNNRPIDGMDAVERHRRYAESVQYDDRFFESLLRDAEDKNRARAEGPDQTNEEEPK